MEELYNIGQKVAKERISPEKKGVGVAQDGSDAMDPEIAKLLKGVRKKDQRRF